ncbi:hypothetical protein AB0J43_30395 [Nonomuraea fuscirosea]
MVEAISWPAARALAAAAACPGKPETVPLRQALGRRLAGPLTALVAVPGTDVSAMDGYAVAGPGPWRVGARVLAGGAAHDRPLRAGEAVEIATGAPVPAGAGSVLPYERADATGGQVRGPAEEGRHIRRRGEDVPEGAVVLAEGAVVTPVALGLAAALGHDELPVRPRPRVAVLVTGDEVVDRGLPGPGRVRDAIGPYPRDTRLVPVLRSELGAIPAGHDRPGSLWGAALAGALAVVPPGWSGERVELIELPPGV